MRLPCTCPWRLPTCMRLRPPGRTHWCCGRLGGLCSGTLATAARPHHGGQQHQSSSHTRMRTQAQTVKARPSSSHCKGAGGHHVVCTCEAGGGDVLLQRRNEAEQVARLAAACVCVCMPYAQRPHSCMHVHAAACVEAAICTGTSPGCRSSPHVPTHVPGSRPKLVQGRGGCTPDLHTRALVACGSRLWYSTHLCQGQASTCDASLICASCLE